MIWLRFAATRSPAKRGAILGEAASSLHWPRLGKNWSWTRQGIDEARAGEGIVFAPSHCR